MPSVKQPVGIQSVEIGVDVLQALAGIGHPASLGVIAKACKMQPNKVHRYLASLVRTGLVSQQNESGDYELGPQLRVLGLTALRLLDPYQRLFDRLRDLREQTQLTTLLAVWSDAGATVIGWENGVKNTSVTFRLGSTLPLARSATGRVFLAHLPPLLTRAVAKREQTLEGRSSTSKMPTSEELAAIRKSGYAHASDEILPGVEALSAPIFDDAASVFAVFTVLGPRRYMEGRAIDSTRQMLMRSAAAASAELGYRIPR